MAFASAKPPRLHMAEDRSNDTPVVPADRSITSPRSLKQLSLFLAGSSFLAISALITRRHIVRRYHATVPRFYVPSNRPLSSTVNGRLEAVEALSLATINVASFAMMMIGGAFWATDISTVDELRERMKTKKAIDGTERPNNDADKELEDWLAAALGRKDENGEKKSTEAEEQGE